MKIKTTDVYLEYGDGLAGGDLRKNKINHHKLTETDTLKKHQQT